VIAPQHVAVNLFVLSEVLTLLMFLFFDFLRAFSFALFFVAMASA